MKYFETFAGTGGFSLGIERAYGLFNAGRASEECSKNGEPVPVPPVSDGTGGRSHTDNHPLCVGHSEIDKYASAVLKYNYPNVPNYGDISKIDWNTVPDFDLLVGGSPCQDFSIAGKRSGLVGERSGLFTEYLRALEEKQPQYFIWENVKGVLSSRSGWDFANIQVAFSEAGYSLWWQVLNAKDFGVPQNRERIFVFGTRNGSPREILFERESSPSDSDSRIVGGTLTARYPASQREGAYIEEARNDGGATGEIEQLNNPKHSNDRVYGEEGLSPTLNTMQGGRRQPFVQVPEATKKGYAVAHEGDSINISVPNSKTRRGRVGKGVAQTLDTGMQQHTLEGTRIRRLTPSECMALMSWPRDWCDKGVFDGEVKEISDTQKYKMAGNGVVSNCVEAIVREHIIDKPE